MRSGNQGVESAMEGKIGLALRRRGLVLVGLLLGIGLLLYGYASWRSLVAPLVPSAAPVADVSSERLLAQGSIVGLASAHDTHAWLGIPFA